MSDNPSRAEKTEGQLRRPGRSGSFSQQNHHKGYSGGGKGGGGTGSSAPPHPSSPRSAAAPPSSIPVAQTLSASRSFKKAGVGSSGQPRVNFQITNSGAASAASNTHHPVENGFTYATASANPVNMPTPRTAPRAVPKAPSSQTTAGTSSNSASTSTAKGDASKQFTLQFGTINPGLMIPARTSSAPPNLDEQKQDQARHESSRPIPMAPISTAPKLLQQQQTKKDVSAAGQSAARQSQPPLPTKRDVPVAVQPSQIVAPPRASVIPIFQHPQTQVPIQFSGPNPQMQPQGLGANSLQMTMTLPVASAHHVPQQFYYPGQMLPQQAMVHPGQGMGFAPPIGHQLSPQIGNIGIGVPSQFPQQQPGKLVGPRKTTVKITHPDTHEELRLDNRTDSFKDGMPSSQRILPNVPSQPQTIPAFTHQMNYFSSGQPNSFNPSQHPFPTTTSVSLTNNQVPPSSQASRYSYAVNQSGQSINFMNSAMLNPVTGGKPVHQNPLHGLSDGNYLQASPVSSSSTLAPSKITLKTAAASQTEKAVAPSLTSSVTANANIAKTDTSNPPKPAIDVSTYQKNDEDREVAQDNQNQQPKQAESKLASEPVKNVSLPLRDEFSSSVTPAVSLHKAMPETFSPSLTSLTPAEDAGPVPAENVIEEKEPVRRSNSMKDNQRKTIKKDIVNTQQEQQLDPSNVADSQNVSPKNSRDSSVEKSSSNLENIQVPSESNFSSATSLAESKDVKNEAVEDSASLASSSSFITALEIRSSEKIPPVAVDAFILAADPAPVKETESSGPLVSLEATADQNMGKKLDADIFQGDESADSERKANAEATLLQKAEVLEDISTGSDITDLNLDSNINKCSGYLDQIISPACEYDESKELSSTAIKLSNLEEPERNAIATECNVVENRGTDSIISVALETSLSSDAGSSNITEKTEDTTLKSSSGCTVSSLGLVTREKPSSDSSRPKTIAGKKKKKREICAKADAAGTTDLYNAYIGPEENHQVSSRSEAIDSSSPPDMDLVHVDNSRKEAVSCKEDDQNKTELEDWENAADISTPKLKAEHAQPLNGEVKQHEEGNEASRRKKYSKDFLLTFQQHITELPIGFQVGPDIAELLMSNSIGKLNVVEREPYTSSGRIIDRPSGASRGDRRMTDDDRWTRSPGSFTAGRDLRSDVAHGVVVSLRPGQGPNHGRNMRSPSFNGGILSGPMQPLVPPAGMPRSNSDADRWQRTAGIQRGLIPSPQTPSQVMHKAEKKYEVGKVTGEEQAKQRQLKAILNKLTPQNFEKLFAQVKEVNIDNAVTLTGVISQIFDKALMEPTFCEMYASFCVQLAGELPEIIEDNEKITFRRLLLNKCQEEFERGEREQAEASKTEVEGETKKSREEREEQRIRARRRMLGNIRLIGELYKKKMLTDKIMHECIIKLLGQYENPDEEDVECLCKLMTTIGEIIDHPKAKDHMDAYFNVMGKLSTNMKLSSRVRFMLKDVIDLRKNKWQQRRKVEGPKKIEEVHRDAAQERQAQSSRLARGPSLSSGSRRGPVGDYNTRGSIPLASSSQHVAGARAMPSQVRGYASQDVRSDDRHQFESKTLSLPLPHRSIDDDSITLGPQGGLGRGMSIRGQPLMPSPSTAETVSSAGDHRRVLSGQNGNNLPPDWTREDAPNRYVADRFSGGIYDQPGSQDRKMYGGVNREPKTSDRTFDRPASLPHAGRANISSANTQTSASETKIASEEVLREKSISAIREFYSAKNEKEVRLCIKELNCPSFYPWMLSLWINDSFEMKDMQRDLLAKLIVSLCSTGDSLVSQMQLIEGFRDVLVSLEDSVNDAPRAAEFLGRIFAKVILEDVITLRDAGRLIWEGGEKPGRLREIGLAEEVLGSILESIRLEKGDSMLNEIRASSNLNLEDFRPPPPIKSKKLDAFL